MSGIRMKMAGSALSALLFTAVAFSQDGGKRVALVIGNDAYSLSPLKNAVNDARAIDRALQSAGFKTKLLENASKDQMDDALGVFADSLGPDDSALFYYAGHAFQIENENFIVPVDFKPAAGMSQAKNRCVSLSRLFDELKRARAKIKIVVLDACRANPIAEQYSLAAGLAEPLNAGKGSYIAFSTGPNQVATDNPVGKNSWFTEALADLVSQPTLTIEINELFNRVRKRVEGETEGRQTPWSQSSLISNFYFHPPANEEAESDSTLIDRWMQEARRREQREDWPEAIELVNQVLKKKPADAAAKSKLPYLIARRDAQASFEANDYAKAAQLFEQAFQLDPFAIDAAVQGVNSHLLGGNLPAAVQLLKSVRVRGTSESVQKANAVLKELAAVYPEAAQELRAGIPQPPPFEEVFGGIHFGVPDWDAGKRLLEGTPLDLSRWSTELASNFTPPAVAAPITQPVPSASTTQVAAAGPATNAPSGAANVDLHPTDAGDRGFHVEVISVGATRELDYEAVTTDTSPSIPGTQTPAKPKRPKGKPPEFGFVEFEGAASDTAVLVNGKPAVQQAPGKLQLPPGTYEIRTVRQGKIEFRQQDVEVKPSETTKIKVQQ